MKRIRIIIDREKCKGCHICTKFCPRDVLVVSESPNSMGYFPVEPAGIENCTGCCSCAIMCPDTAITIIQEVHHEEEAVDVGK